jgi:hypothetical protein
VFGELFNLGILIGIGLLLLFLNVVPLGTAPPFFWGGGGGGGGGVGGGKLNVVLLCLIQWGFECLERLFSSDCFLFLGYVLDCFCCL